MGRQTVKAGVSQIDDVVRIGDDDEIAAELIAVILDQIENRPGRCIDVGIVEQGMIELDHVMVR